MPSRNLCTNQCWGVVIVLSPRVLDECDFVCELFMNVILSESYLMIACELYNNLCCNKYVASAYVQLTYADCIRNMSCLFYHMCDSI